MFDNTLKTLKKLGGKVLNSTVTYFVLFAIILIQFFLVSIIFFQNKELTAGAAALSRIESRQNDLNAGLNALQSNLMRLQADFYRLQNIR